MHASGDFEMLEKYLTSLKPEETILVRRDWPCCHAWQGGGMLPCAEGDQPGIS